MTPEAMRVAIAECVGWKSRKESWPSKPYQRIAWCPPDREDTWLTNPPDFCNDLNAMHEAEKALENDPEKDAMYWLLLHRITEADDNTGHWLDLKATGHATAAQRAEAFLKTLNRWEE